MPQLNSKPITSKQIVPFWLATAILLIVAAAIILITSFLVGDMANIKAPVISQNQQKQAATKRLSYAGVIESLTDNQLIMRVPRRIVGVSIKLTSATKYVGFVLPQLSSQPISVKPGIIQLTEKSLALKDFKVGDQITVAGHYEDSAPDVLVASRIQKALTL